MKKKVLALVLAIAMVAALCIGLVACDKTPDFRVGFIMLHGEDSTYDKNFIDAARQATEELGLKKNQVIIKTNIDETNECTEAALDLVDQGCDIIFADSFGHGPFMYEAAKQHPEVQFCHATGTGAHDNTDVSNLHNAFASIYQGRYLAGVAAGAKLNEMITAGTITAEQAVIGYVGAFTYAEVISGFTSFFLGARSVCPSATMKVTYTGTWYGVTEEKTAAENLIKNHGCKLISQHADSTGAPSACEENNTPNVSYNGSTESTGPNTYIVSSRINWVPYFKYMISQVQKGEAIDKDWVGTIENGAVEISALSKNAAAGTQELIDAAKTGLANGSVKVFDTTKFTVSTPVEGLMVDATNHVTSFKVRNIEVVANGEFKESMVSVQSAPYFSLIIDGITQLNTNFGKND